MGILSIDTGNSCRTFSIVDDYIYLHGFASSPKSAKAQNIRDRFAEIQTKLKIPDLNAGDFSQFNYHSPR
ncbi:YqiA/YcfP family alpha/beta fold hydrolase [Nodularia spumigena]|uniref:YqiA/YcfP family alpha/beta fold hydrolase n=1 Tax=Nodularia spumigena TaxID=70799 RepID=UPI001E404C65|nr:YqiA/YcfP family alpha/beta fold hydrolase [Nodularia spumigena]